jgi:NADH dehydrogenase
MIFLTGATGYLGSRVLDLLLERKIPLRIITRGNFDWKEGRLSKLRHQGVDVIIGDLRNQNLLSAALEGVTGIVNLAGIYHQNRENTFEDVHVNSLINMVAYAQDYGIQRFVHLSCLAATGLTQSAFLKSKWKSDQIVSQGDYYWTIIRPSWIFGDACFFDRWFQSSTQLLPIIPMPGSGLNAVSPVFVDDLALAIADCIYMQETAGKTLELAGPKSYTLKQMYNFMLERMQMKKQIVNISSERVLKMTGFLEKFLKNQEDLMAMAEVFSIIMTESTSNKSDFQDVFKINPTPLEDYFL